MPTSKAGDFYNHRVAHRLTFHAQAVFRRTPMSQKPAPKTVAHPRVAHPRVARPRVASGVPWWIWGLIIVVGSGVGYSLLQKSIPEDPAAIFAEAMKAAEAKDGPLMREHLQKLKAYPEFEKQQKLLDGMLLLGGSRPIKAIGFLKEAAEEPSLRTKALMYLGLAYAQGENYKMAISTFETVLSEDESADEVRLSLAVIFQEIFAWNEALSHLNVLVDRNFQPSRVYRMRGDIHFDLGQYKEGAADYEASINADKNDPTNSLKAEHLVQCLSKIGEYEKAEEYIANVDMPGARDFLTAEKRLAEGDTQGLAVALEGIFQHVPNDARAHKMSGKSALKQNSPEKAAEALVSLRKIAVFSPRDVEVYRLVADLSRLIGDDQLANLAQQNVDQLIELKKQFDETFTAVIGTQDDVDARLKLASLASQLGNPELALKIYDSLLHSNPDRSMEVAPLRKLLFTTPVPPLLSISASEDPAGTEKPDAPEIAPGNSPAAPEPSPGEPKSAETPATESEEAPAPEAKESTASDAKETAAPDSKEKSPKEQKPEPSESDVPDAESAP